MAVSGKGESPANAEETIKVQTLKIDKALLPGRNRFGLTKALAGNGVLVDVRFIGKEAITPSTFPRDNNALPGKNQ